MMQNNSQSVVYQRFINATNRLLETGLAESKAEIGRTMGLSKSQTNEIFKGRNRLYAHHIHDLVTNYPISPLYMFGISDQILVDTPTHESTVMHVAEGQEAYTHPRSKQNASPNTSKNASAAASPNPVLEQLLGEKDRVIVTQERSIKALEETVTLLREKCAEKR